MTTLNAVTFTDDLQWTDECDWSPVAQSSERSITGALLLQHGAMAAGRPITLQADSDSAGWFTREQVEALYALAAVPGNVMTLTYRGVARQVVFRHAEGAMNCRPVVPFADVQAGDYYHVTLRFLTV